MQRQALLHRPNGQVRLISKDRKVRHRFKSSGALSQNLIQIQNGTFYREHPSSASRSTSSNPPLFPNLTFSLPATIESRIGKPLRKSQHWAVIGAFDTTSFLDVLRGQHICVPPNARSYPHLASDEIGRRDHRLRAPSRAIQYVGFNVGKGQSSVSGIRGAYLSARYESHREETDWSVMQYLRGKTELNPWEDQEGQGIAEDLLCQVVKDLRLQKLIDMPVSNLSNGQTRRARIAKALLGTPELLLLDEPFMGLDPPTLVSLSPILRDLAYKSQPLLVLGLRPQDPIPNWITHLAVLGKQYSVALMGEKDQVLFSLHRWLDVATSRGDVPELVAAMAERMTETYGQPLQDVGDTLGSNGVVPYQSYKQVKTTFINQYLSNNGSVKQQTLDALDQERCRSITSTLGSDITAQDLITMTTTLPNELKKQLASPNSFTSNQTQNSIKTDSKHTFKINRPLGDPIIELQSVVVKYGDKVVLGHPPVQPGYSQPGLNLTITQGTRLALLGPNGSGKTTFLSLLTSDHPQSYSLPIKFFGRTRLPETGKPGLSLWEIQSRIGHCSPEIHAFFPKLFSIRRVLESAWADTFSSPPKMNDERARIVDGTLRWWEPELRQNQPFASAIHHSISTNSNTTNTVEQNYPPPTASNDVSWAQDKENHPFRTLPFGTQRLLLLLRAMIKSPDIIILDEAFSGLSAEVREKAMCWLEHGETMFLSSNPSSNPSSSTTSSNTTVTTIDDTQATKAQRSEAEAWQNRKVANNPKSADPFAISGLSDRQALVVVSHVKEEIPYVVDEYVRLPGEDEVLESGRAIEMGYCPDGSIRSSEGWNRIWGL